MKKNLFFAALIVALCTSPSFAQHQLLNRMLGRCGCSAPATSCCESPAPTTNSCCQTFESDSSCGCGKIRGLFPLFGHGNRGNDCGSGCGCAAAPAAAPCCEPADPCARKRCSLFSGLCNRGNDCGCEDTCDKGCGRGHLFAGHGGRGCGDPCDDGCGGGRGRLFAGHGGHGDCGGCDKGCGGCRIGTREVCFKVPSFGCLDRARSCRPQRNACCDPCQSACGNGSVGSPAPAGAPGIEPTPAPANVEPQPAAPAPSIPETSAAPAAGSTTRFVPMVDPNAFQSPTTRFTSNEID